MECRQYEIGFDGYRKLVDVCKDADLPPYIKGATNKTDKIWINKYLDDLHDIGISDPETYVLIHECFHILHPEKSEYEIRRLSDEEYEYQTGEKIDTTSFFEKIDSKTRGYIV